MNPPETFTHLFHFTFIDRANGKDFLGIFVLVFLDGIFSSLDTVFSFFLFRNKLSSIHWDCSFLRMAAYSCCRVIFHVSPSFLNINADPFSSSFTISSVSIRVLNSAVKI